MARVWDAGTGQPLTEWLFAGNKITSLCFDATGRRIATGAEGGLARVWEVPVPPLPVPAWFPAFAEAVAGTRLNRLGNVERLSHGELEATARQLAERSEAEFYQRLSQWLLADPAQRAASPFSDAD